jgi:hypothetical protein
MNRLFVLSAVSLLAVATLAFGQQGPSAQPGGVPGDLSNKPSDPQQTLAEARKDVQSAFARLLKGEVPLSEVRIFATDPAIKGILQVYGSGVGFVDNVQINLTPEQIKDLLGKLDKGRFFELEHRVGVPPKGAPLPPKGPTLPPDMQPRPPMLQVFIGKDVWGVEQLRFGGDQSMQFSTLMRQLREAVTPLKANGLDLSKLTLNDAFEKLAKGEVAVEALQVSASGKDWSFILTHGVILFNYGVHGSPSIKLKAQLIQDLAAKAGKANTAFRDRRPAKLSDPILVYDPKGQLDDMRVDQMRFDIPGVPGSLYFANNREALDPKAGKNNPAAENAYAELAKAVKQTHDDVLKESQAIAPPGPGGNGPQPRPGNPGRPTGFFVGGEGPPLQVPVKAPPNP